MRILKNILPLVLALAGITAILAFYVISSKPEHAIASGYTIVCTDLVRSGVVNNGCSATGTTTPTFLTAAAATTTFAALTANTANEDLNLMVVASSTSSVITWSVQYSYNGVDWYNEDLPATSGSVTTHPALPITHTWTPGTTATTSRSMNLQTHAAKYTRIGFQATGANASIYPQFILQNTPIQ